MVNQSRLGVRAVLMALPSARGLIPQPSMMSKNTKRLCIRILSIVISCRVSRPRFAWPNAEYKYFRIETLESRLFCHCEPACPTCLAGRRAVRRVRQSGIVPAGTTSCRGSGVIRGIFRADVLLQLLYRLQPSSRRCAYLPCAFDASCRQRRKR